MGESNDIYHDYHNGNEFLPTPDEEPTDQLPTGKEECFQLGRGDYSPTTEDRKGNSEDKMYFHPVRLPCQLEGGDVALSMESRLSSSWQREAASQFSIGKTERQPTKWMRTRRCNKLGRGGLAGSDINRVSSFNKHVKKANVRFRSGRGVKQKLIQEINLPTGSQPTSPKQRGYTTRKLSKLPSRTDRRVANRPSKEGRKPLLDVQLAGAQDSCRSLLKRTCEQG